MELDRTADTGKQSAVYADDIMEHKVTLSNQKGKNGFPEESVTSFKSKDDAEPQTEMREEREKPDPFRVRTGTDQGSIKKSYEKGLLPGG